MIGLLSRSLVVTSRASLSWTLCHASRSHLSQAASRSPNAMRLFSLASLRIPSSASKDILKPSKVLTALKNGGPTVIAVAIGVRYTGPWSRIAYCEADHIQPLKTIPIVTRAKVLAEVSPRRRSLFREIWDLIRPDIDLLLFVVLTTVAAAIVQLQTPAITGELVNILTSGFKTTAMSIPNLTRPAIRLFSLLSAQGLLTFLHITLVAAFGERLAHRLKKQLFSAMVQQDMSFFDARQSGELVGRLTSDVSEFKSTFKQMVTLGLKSITQTLGSAIHLFRISAPLTLTMLATMPPLYLLLNLYGAYLRRLSRHGKQLDGAASGVAGEVISNMRTVRAFAAEEREIDHYAKACAKVSAANQYMGLHIGLLQGLTNVAIGCMVLTVMYCGGTMVMRNEMTSGDLMTYMLSIQTAQQSLVSLGVLFGQSIKAASSAARVFEFVHLEPRVPIHGGAVIDHVQGYIHFRNVSFTYPSRADHPVLDQFSLDFRPGTTVALCGPSGSGKSTIASLLERFYEPVEGHIYLDGRDLSTLDPSWLRHQIGFINQEPVLFATSILENIRYGRPDATMEEVEEAAQKANAASFIQSFPQGYNTIVGERGASLSGGQKQRIAIARAILKDPKVLILDEATSALDTQSEKMVQEALDTLMAGRTVLVIAHRLSTIRKADSIVVMGRVPGNIIEKGTHDELLANRSIYYRLHNQLEQAVE